MQIIYYVPLFVVPGRMAFIDREKAFEYASRIGSSVVDESGNSVDSMVSFWS
jgi:hypothetical protein